MTTEGNRSNNNKTLLVVGIGSGIGRSVTSLFASQRYDNVALIARRAEQLEMEKTLLEEAVNISSTGSRERPVTVKTFAVDVVDTDALTKALDESDEALGKPECVFWNAVRVLPSELLSHHVKEIDYDFKINVSALYVTAQRYIPHLVELAQSDSHHHGGGSSSSSSTALPSFIVTSSMLPQDPQPFVFALSLVKAAQRNLMQSLNKTYASSGSTAGKGGVNIGLINVRGPVSPEHATWSPSNIAEKAWSWFSGYRENPAFEVII